MEPGVSVIVCSYNGVLRLPETIRHLALQQVPPGMNWEIIVIDNASTDASAGTARLEWEKYPDKTAGFTILKEPLAGKNHAFMAGVRESRYTYILTCDDDNWLNPGYVARAFQLMEADPEIGALGGRGLFKAEEPLNKEIEGFTSSYVNGSQTWASIEHWVYGAGSVYRKNIFTTLVEEGWQQITTGRKGKSLICGEDVEICFMIYLCGFKVVADDELTFVHFVPATRQRISYIIDLNFGLNYTHVLLNSYFAILNKDQRPIKKIIDDWFISFSKTFFKRFLLLIISKIKWWDAYPVDQQLLFSQSFGTWYSLLKNRKRITAHHTHTKAVLTRIGRKINRGQNEL